MVNEFGLADTTVDFEQFVAQFTAAAQNKDIWKGELTTQTSTTLIQLVSSVGTFAIGRMLRHVEDSFSETASSDAAIHAIAVMQGIRLTRKLPAAVQCTLTATEHTTLSPYEQFNVGGIPFFTRTSITLEPNVPKDVTLFEGSTKAIRVSGLGTDHQAIISQESKFTVSDLDVVLVVNGTIIQKALNGLWNYEGVAAYSDFTHSTGRLLVQFGSGKYGLVPQINDQLVLLYAVTSGAEGNTLVTVNKRIVADNNSAVSGVCLANPIGGSDEKSVLAYKNISSGAFGTYGSAVTPAQYRALVTTYPGIQDCLLQAQREINPGAVQWMNVIRASGLTASPWTNEQKRAFCDAIQDQAMFAPHVVWQDPVAVGRDVVLVVYCFNTAIPSIVKTRTEQAIHDMFAPKPGLLNTNFYESDFWAATAKANPGAVSYVKLLSPASGEMVVTAPESPTINATVIPGAGTLEPLLYAYGISVVNASGEEGPPTKWVFPQVVSGLTAAINLSWTNERGAAFYKIYGRRAGRIGLLAVIPAGTTLWTDDGSIEPTTQPPNLMSELPIRYNTLRSLEVRVEFSDRQNVVV